MDAACWLGSLVYGDCAVGADLAGGDVLAAVAEDVALEEWLVAVLDECEWWNVLRSDSASPG